MNTLKWMMFLTLALVATAVAAIDPHCCNLGDANGDGTLSASDLLAIDKHLLSLTCMTATHFANGCWGPPVRCRQSPIRWPGAVDGEPWRTPGALDSDQMTPTWVSESIRRARPFRGAV